MPHTRQFLVYADDVILLGGNMYTLNKITETLINASKDIRSKNTCRENYIYVSVSSPEYRSKSR
jgi:hypothetical protein